MLYKRKGMPEEGEIVLCKVTKIYPNSVFVDLLEFNDSGMIHISEVSPGRIRNLREFVSVGRQIVCKVLRIHLDRGHIDLSLRRVNSSQRREKLDEIKQELKSEQLVLNLAKKLNKDGRTLYKEISAKVFSDYSHLYLCFRDVVEDSADLKKIGIPAEIAKELKDAILDKFKPSSIFIKGEIKIMTYDSNGLKKIKTFLKEIEDVSSTISLQYLGAGRYKFVIEDLDYKPAEENLTKINSIIESFTDKVSSATLEREK